MTVAKKYITKRDSIFDLMHMFDVSEEELHAKYNSKQFINKLTSPVIDQCLSLNFSKETEHKLNNLCAITYNRDKRTPIEYALDLVYGWLTEDIVTIYLNRKGFNAKLIGADKDREFLKSKSVSSDADLIIDGRAADIYADMDGYWAKTGTLDLRINKYKKLVQEKSILIGVSSKFEQILLLDFSTNIDVEIRSNPNWGGKEVATINNINRKVIELDNFKSDLYNIIHN
jgi:hypothetical protein